jgi:DNA-binding PadR family transcriptional regulator
MAFRADFEAIILGTLQQGDMHGYAIARTIENLSEGTISIGEGQLYPALQKLELSGLVQSTWEAQTGKPNRRIYTITELGERELRRRRARWMKFSNAVESLLDSPVPVSAVTSRVGTPTR